jgi:hypothetical protein
MGIGSLAIGIALITFGFGVIILPTDTALMSDEDVEYLIISELIIALPSIAIGGLFLRKYDKDKKKRKNS